VPIYNGTQMQLYQFTSSTSDKVGLSLALGSNWTANTVYDVFATLNSGSPTLCTVAWSSGTARATALALFDGLQTNSASVTCRNSNSTTLTVAANQGTYLGTIVTDASTAGQLDFTLGTSAAGGGAAVIGLWNEYNRVSLSTTVKNSTAAWPYANTTIENANASANMRITAVFGLAEEQIQATYNSEISPASNAVCYLNVGLDATAFSGNTGVAAGPASGAGVQSTPASLSSFFPQIGLHFIQATAATNANSCTFNNFVSPATPEYLQGSWRY
jgi:hypothetical protein